jgi:AraC family transcriptional regulator
MLVLSFIIFLQKAVIILSLSKYLCVIEETRMTELFIKNMVCNRCIMVVRQELLYLGLEPLTVELGMVKLPGDVSQALRKKLGDNLKTVGFELLDNAKSKLLDQIKTVIIQSIHHTGPLEMTVNWSQLISSELNYEYKYLSSLFSSIEGMTIAHYIILQKIERVKELLSYQELSLTEIAYQLGYSSVQHLSLQFKKTTGQTPSQYVSSEMMKEQRNPLDSI